MEQTTVSNRSAKRLIRSKLVFVSAIVLSMLTILVVWISGIGIHRSMFKNALITTSIVSLISFLFFSIALFNGWKLKDNLGKISHRFKWAKFSDLSNSGFDGSGSGGSGHSHGFLEGIGETFEAIVFGIIAIIFLLGLLWLFGNLLSAFVLFAAAILYWIFFRAVRFVLRHSSKCKGNFWKSIGYGFFHTLLYFSTFYLFILASYFTNR